MSWAIQKMRKPDPGEPFMSRFVWRPTMWLAYQFSGEARFIRQGRRERGI